MTTRNKRASALLVGLAFRAVLPAPDSSVDMLDRPVVAYCYAIEAEAVQQTCVWLTSPRSNLLESRRSNLFAVEAVSNLLESEPAPSNVLLCEGVSNVLLCGGESNVLLVDAVSNVLAVEARSNVLEADAVSTVLAADGESSVLESERSNVFESGSCHG